MTKKNKGCITLSPCHLHKKKYLNAKEEYNLQKNPPKETKILQDIILYN
jgi:hypothetical protein